MRRRCPHRSVAPRDPFRPIVPVGSPLDNPGEEFYCPWLVSSVVNHRPRLPFPSPAPVTERSGRSVALGRVRHPVRAQVWEVGVRTLKGPCVCFAGGVYTPERVPKTFYTTVPESESKE